MTGATGPDQPRSWAIAMAGCAINALLSGITRASGLLYVAFLEEYGCSRQEANLPFTTRNGVRNLLGPLVGAIGQRYGARDATVIGGVLGALGVGLCAFSPNILWITAMWGGIHGSGVALGNTLFAVTINQYFVKYRATASGIALSGACVGAFVLPIVLEYLLTNFGLSGTFMITGGLLLNVLPASILLKEPPWLNNNSNRFRTKVSKSAPMITIQTVKDEKSHQVMSSIQEEAADFVVNGNVVEAGNAEKGTSVCESSRSSCTVKDSGKDNPGFLGSNLDLYKPPCDQKLQEDSTWEPRFRTVSIGEASITFPSPDDPSQQEVSLHRGVARLLSDPMFYMISATFTAFAMLIDPIFTVIVDYIKDKGVDEDNGKYLISMMSLGDLVGRLCFGWVTDKDFLSVPRFMLLIFVAQGVFAILLTFYDSFKILIALMVAYGLVTGATVVMIPILVARYLTSVQSLAIGCISFLSGLLAFAVPPLIGYFRDSVGSYDGMFIITGGMTIAAGFCWLLEPLCMKLKYRSKHSSSICIST